MRVWSLAGEQPECIATLTHGSKVQGIAISRKGGFIASVGTGDVKKVVVWRAAEPAKPGKR